jgi:hypothetical protein
MVLKMIRRSLKLLLPIMPSTTTKKLSAAIGLDEREVYALAKNDSLQSEMFFKISADALQTVFKIYWYGASDQVYCPHFERLKTWVKVFFGRVTSLLL